MTQKRTTKTRKAEQRAEAAPAPAQPIEAVKPIRCRFIVRLPDLEPVSPPGDQSSPAWRLFHSFYGIFTAVADQIGGLAEPGIIAFDVEAAYQDAPPGGIPELEDGPLGNQLRDNLPAVMRQESQELRTIIEERLAGRKQVKVAVIYLQQPKYNVTNEQIVNFINYSVDFVNDVQPEQISQKISGDHRQQLLDALLVTISRDANYEVQVTQVEKLLSDVKRQSANRLLPSLKDAMRSRSHDTFEEKKELVKWVNAELRRLSMAFKSPKTNMAATLNADKGNHPAEGRFQLRSEGADGKVETFSTPKLEVLLDALDLIDAPPREEGLANWTDRAKQSKSARPIRP